ncbi:MAG: DUF393 domain-containing protein [Candidatus Marinimicrobia bacterium]|nr:DUF393 domain-containing protein [Candidatus Neomarinimicrobiota bacterium]
MIMLRKYIQKWLYVDVRVLALFRIIFGFLGILDVLRRYYLIDVFYSTSGMNFRREVTSKYSIKYFTLLDHFLTTTEVQLFFIITALCFFCLMVGYRTRLFQILSAVGLISIHNAAVILENGGDMAFNNYLIWTMFLPLGTSWSIDSLRKSIREIPEYDLNDLNKKVIPKSTHYFHFAYVACLVQLSMIYFYAGLNKTGAMWKDGTAVFYAYQLETFLTPIGECVSQYMNFELSYFMTHSAPHVQMFAPIAIFFPVLQPWMRRMVFITFIGFHGLIEICFGIGLFGWIMFSALLLLLSQEDINIMKTMLSRCFNREYIVFYDRDCGFCHFIARIIKRMDVFSRLTWADRLTENNNPKKLNNLLKNTIVILDPKTDKVWTRHRGFARIISVLPFGFLFSWILCIPGLEKLFGYIYDLISNNRIHLSKIMGLPACGIVDENLTSKLPKEDHVFFSMGKKGIGIASNLLVLMLLIGAVDYSTMVNKGYRKYSSKEAKNIKKVKKSTYHINARQKMKRILLYPRMHQNWNMFAPTVLRNEKWVIAEITFKDGEKLSLFKENENVEENFEYQYFTKKNQFWRKFFNRINKSGYKKYILQFKKWLTNTDYFSEYSGREVVEVKVWQLLESSPNLNMAPEDRPKVRKIELLGTKKENRKSKKIRKLKKSQLRKK